MSGSRFAPAALVAAAIIAALSFGCGSSDDATGGAPTTVASTTTQTVAHTQVKVFFPRGDPGPNCRRVLPVTRTVSGPAVLRRAMDALLRGPTAAERRAGYDGWFSAATAGRVRSVRIAGSVARIDFRDFSRIIPNASTSCGSALLMAQLNRTARQFPTVGRAVYSFDGSVPDFYLWLQMSPPQS